MPAMLGRGRRPGNTVEGIDQRHRTGYHGSMVTVTQANRFAHELRRWRTTRRVSQLELALRAGTTQRHLSYIEQGRSQPGRGIVLRLALHPDGMAPRVANLPEWGRHIIHNLRAQALRSPDDRLDAFIAELEGYVPALPAGPDHIGFAVPLRLRCDEGELRLITTLTSFATATDVTLAELHLEAFLPADEASAEILRRRAQR
jgi:transcriptional regulator with XRE-family HTH domain